MKHDVAMRSCKLPDSTTLSWGRLMCRGLCGSVRCLQSAVCEQALFDQTHCCWRPLGFRMRKHLHARCRSLLIEQHCQSLVCRHAGTES